MPACRAWDCYNFLQLQALMRTGSASVPKAARRLHRPELDLLDLCPHLVLNQVHHLLRIHVQLRHYLSSEIDIKVMNVIDNGAAVALNHIRFLLVIDYLRTFRNDVCVAMGFLFLLPLFDLRGNIPAFVYLTDASIHDVRILDELCIEMGAIYVMDKGYVDFFRLFNRIHKNRAFFVTRAKDNMQYDVVKSNPVDKHSGVIVDEIIKLTTYKSAKCYPEELRMVTYEDFATGNVYRFLTNHLGYEALTIAELYRERWNVELFFKWIKQHLHIKSFYGTSENAVYTQIWIAVCSFLLIALAKKKWNLDQSLYTISPTIGFVLFEKTPINQLFIKSKNLVPADDYPNLFSFSES
jgi:hypothetical protein